MERFNLIIVIPALNEEKTIGKVIDATKKYGDIVVVDDGSTDKTKIIAKSYGVEVITHMLNMGYEAALESGFQYALQKKYSCMVTLDADGQHNPELIEQFIEQIKLGADIAVGRRDKLQRIGEKAFAYIWSRVAKVEDPLCGMKAYSLSTLSEYKYFDRKKLVGTELLARAVRDKKKIIQLSIKTFPRIDKPRFGNILFSNIRIVIALSKTLTILFFKEKND